MNEHTSHPDWLPRRGQHVRWDRALAHGDCAFRWHSRLDGSALLYGPAGKLVVGDTVAMPVGHLHRPGDPPPVLYVVTRSHQTEEGHVWLEAVKQSEP